MQPGARSFAYLHIKVSEQGANARPSEMPLSTALSLYHLVGLDNMCGPGLAQLAASCDPKYIKFSAAERYCYEPERGENA